MLDKIFEEIGTKIKTLAKWTLIIGAIGAVVGGIVMVSVEDDLIALVVPVVFVGILYALISSLILYGLGELIDNTAAIAINTGATLRKLITEQAPAPKDAPAQPKSTPAPEKPAPIVAPAAEKPSVVQVTTAPPADKKPVVEDGTYISGRTYWNGEQVKFEGIWYVCRAKSSGTVWSPKQNPALWEALPDDAAPTQE